jgi:beta-1,4-mannosyl-glycoprotein beta-1,4-N-acetylglucosaminyltransferase
MKVFDCFTFYNELDLLELRLNELNDVVDYFVIVESTRTQTGYIKELYFDKYKDRFSKFHSKIIHIIVNGLPNTKYINAWILENFQRNQIIRGLTFANNEDVILISDVDEIPNPKDIPLIKDMLTKKKNIKEKMSRLININLQAFFNLFNTPELTFKNKVFRKINRIIQKVFPNKDIIILNSKWYYYYFNGDAEHTAPNTRICKYITLKKDLQGKPHNIRNMFFGNIINSGWHFTYLGGMNRIIDKIKSLADYEKLDNYKHYQLKLELVSNNEAFISNKIKKLNFVKLDNTFPKYLVDNQDKFKEYIHD